MIRLTFPVRAQVRELKLLNIVEEEKNEKEDFCMFHGIHARDEYVHCMRRQQQCRRNNRISLAVFC